MSLPFSRLVVTLLVLLAGGMGASAQTPLRTAQEVCELGNALARQTRPPVVIRGTVTLCYYKAPRLRKWVYVQDATGAVLVYLDDLSADFAPGAQVEVTGTADGGMFGPLINEATVRQTGQGILPEPLQVPAVQLARGAHFGLWVEVAGTVRDAVLVDGEVTLLLSGGGVHFRAVLPGTPDSPPLETWRGARLQLRGVNWTDNEVAAGEPGSFRVMVPASGGVARLPENSGPETVTGTVRARLAGGTLLLQTPSGALIARPLSLLPRSQPGAASLSHPAMEPVLPGDAVELTGHRLKSSGTQVMEDVTWHRTGSREPAPPPPVSADISALREGRHDGRPVVTEGRLTERRLRPAGFFRQEVLSLEQDGRFFEAVLESDRPDLLASLPPGDKIRVTGVAVREPERDSAGGESLQLRLYLSSPADAVSLGPVVPWWSRLGWKGGAGIAAALLLPLVWIVFLRRRIAAQRRAAVRQAEVESRIRASESRFRLLFERSGDPMLLINMGTHQFLDCNEAALQIMRCETRDELLCIPPWDISPEFQPDGQRSQEKARAVLAAVVETGAQRFEWLHRRRDGSLFPVEVVLTCVERGPEPLVFVIWREISARLKMENDLRELNAGLEARVDERTAELRMANEKLQRSERELHRNLLREKELNELKGAFVSMVSHEFRTPLGVIMSSAEILDRYLGRMNDSDRQEHLRSIMRNSRRMASMMEEVLLLSRLDAGRMECRPAPVHLPGMCRRLIDEIHSATTRACPIRFSCDGTATEEATADENLLRYILTNLLSNAVKYSAAGEEVALRLRRENGSAVFDVADRGIGIPQADRVHLFEAFHRGANVGQRRGTGLGLVIVKRCLDLHGGSVEVRSREGEGSTFTVTLPIFP